MVGILGLTLDGMATPMCYGVGSSWLRASSAQDFISVLSSQTASTKGCGGIPRWIGGLIY